MAAKKNPLSAMLNSDRRVQAKEFQRDYTVASTIKGIGDYAVGVTKPVPVSQTSMGRLAQSLGAASGLLKEFSDYQIQKDQLELQSAALEGKIATQEIAGQKALIDLENAKLRGAVTNETIKQQNTQLEMLQEQTSMLELERKLSGMTDEDIETFNVNLENTVEAKSKSKDKALGNALVAAAAEEEAAKGTEREEEAQDQKASLASTVVEQRKGQNLFNDYTQYYEKRVGEALDAFNKETVTNAEANEIVAQIRNDYIEEKGLEKGSEKLRGFNAATKGFNRQKFSEFNSRVQAKAKAIGNEQFIVSVVNSMKGGVELSETQVAEFKIRANEGTLNSFLTAKDGIVNSIKNLRDPEALENFSVILEEQLSDLPVGEGRKLKDTLVYLNTFADIEEAATSLRADIRNKEEVNEAVARDKFEDVVYSLSMSGLTNKEIRAKLSAAATGKSKESYYETFPEQADDIKEVFELFTEDTSIEEINASLNSVSEAVITEKSEQANRFIKSNTKNDVDLSKPKYAEEVFIDIKKLFAPMPGQKGEQTDEAAFLNKFLNDPVTGAGLGLSEYRIALFDRMSGGLFTQYRESREALPDLVKERYDPASDEAKEFLNLELAKYNERLKSGIKSFVEGRVSRVSEITQEGAVPSTTQDEVKALIKQNPFLPIPEIRELLKKQYEEGREARRAEGRRLDPEGKTKKLFNSKNRYETNEKIREVLLGNDLRDRNSEAFTSLSRAAGKLFYVKEGSPFLFNIFGLMEYDKDRKEAVDNYTRLHAQAEQSQQVRMKTGVTAKEILDIAQTAATLPDAELVGNELIIPLIAREDSFNFRDIASPFYYGYPTGERYFSDKDNYDKIMLAARELEDITVPKSFFAKTNPPLRDLKLGDKGSSSFRIKEADVKKAMKDLEMTEDQLLDVAELYGHKDIVSFLRAQYDTNYHRNQRNK